MLVVNKIVKLNFLVIFLAFLACSSSDNNSLNEKVKIKITDGYFYYLRKIDQFSWLFKHSK